MLSDGTLINELCHLDSEVQLSRTLINQLDRHMESICVVRLVNCLITL